MPLIRMETATKERLTGALLVVLALVIVVPELLSGGGEPARTIPQVQNPEDGAPLQTYDIPLNGASSVPAVPRDLPAAAAAETAAVPPPVTSVEIQPATAPAAQSEATVSAAASPRPAEKPSEKPVEKPAAKPEQKAAADIRPPRQARPEAATNSTKPAPTGKWWVQIGVFASRDNAQALAQKLRGAGFTIDVSQMRSNGKELYRLRAGPVADRSAAVAIQSRLDAAGQKKSSLVAP